MRSGPYSSEPRDRNHYAVTGAARRPRCLDCRQLLAVAELELCPPCITALAKEDLS